MRSLLSLLVAVVIVSLTVSAFAAEGDAPKPRRQRPAGLRGVVVKVDGTNLVIKSGRGDTAKEVTVATDDKTEVTLEGKAAKLADLKEGMYVSVTPETGTATKIAAMPPRAPGLRGRVVKVDGTNLVIKSGRGDAAKEVTVATDDKTEVTLDGKAAKLADLKEGMFVSVTPEKGTAAKITARTPRTPAEPKKEA